MGWLERARKAVSDLVAWDRVEREVDEELQTFLELDAEARQRAGARPAEARRAARASFGGIDACREGVRDARLGAAIESVARDVRYSIRLLRRQPGFATAVILTIALGTFPLAATVGMANWLFFRPPPGVTGADRLVHVEFLTRDDTGDTDSTDLSNLNHADLMSHVRSLTGLAGHSDQSASVAAPGVDALHVDVTYVTHDYFQVLGMRLAAGRPFTLDDDRAPGGAPVVILGHALATRLFGDPERAPGRAVLVNGLDFTVIGVAPPEFRGLRNDHFSEMWLPGPTMSRARHLARERWDRDRGGGMFDEFVGRLAANVDLEHARAELIAGTRALADAYPAENSRFRTAEVHVERQPGMSFSSPNTRSEVAFMVAMFASTGGLLLFLAGANVGNLLLFRAARRREELAMRAALGASRWRLLRAHVIEVVLLSVAGGAVGLVLTFWLAQLLEGIVIPEAGFLRLPIDWRVAGLVLAGAAFVGLIFGGVPAVAASSRAGLALAAQRMGQRQGRWLRSSLTVLQLAISLALLVGALLLMATIRNLVDVDVGFDPAQVASANLLPFDNGYDDARSLAFYRELVDRVAAMPGVAAVSVSGAAPGVRASRERVYLPGRDRAETIAVATNNVTTGYFRVLGLPVLEGRTFSRDEVFALPDGTCGPVIVSESLAMDLFGRRDVLGRMLMIPRTRSAMECRVVGVAADVRSGPDAGWERTLYRPLGRAALFRTTVLARSEGTPSLASAALRDAVRSIDPAMPLRLPRSLAKSLGFQLAGRRIISSVLGALAVLGLVMAAVGLYGLVAETVVDRTREFAVRMAIGAGARSILLAVVRRAMVLAGIGIAAGLVLAGGVSRAIRNQLFGVTEMEPWVYLSAAGMLTAVAVLASLAPAVKASRMNPVDVLRGE
jgi:predicted permease